MSERIEIPEWASCLGDNYHQLSDKQKRYLGHLYICTILSSFKTLADDILTDAVSLELSGKRGSGYLLLYQVADIHELEKLSVEQVEKVYMGYLQHANTEKAKSKVEKYLAEKKDVVAAITV